VSSSLPRPAGADHLDGLAGLVTGASIGLGAPTTRTLGDRGVRLALGGRDLKTLDPVAGDTGGFASRETCATHRAPPAPWTPPPPPPPAGSTWW
jgi:hypothetical protein